MTYLFIFLQKRVTADMEGALLRNLSDASGNNLVHVIACLGHVTLLAWLLPSLPAMSDGTILV